jgi:flagellar biosynthesis protein FliR
MSDGDFWISLLLFVSVQVVACLCIMPIFANHIINCCYKINQNKDIDIYKVYSFKN